MTAASPALSPRHGMQARLVQGADAALLGGILLAIAANFFLAARQSINWDEFHYLAQVHAYLRGDLADRLQTFHVHLFAWLPGVSPNEADQIVAARRVMAIVAAANALLIYGIARRFMARPAALFGLCAYLGMSFVVDNGASFRTDPMATLLSLLACFAVLRRPGGTAGAALAGAVMALAMMVTIKSIFYVGTIGLLFLAMGDTWRERFRLGLAFGATAVPVLAALYGLHARSLAMAPDLMPLAGLGGTGSKMFLTDGLFPRWLDWLAGVIANPFLWGAAFVGGLTSVRTIRHDGDRPARRAAWLLLILALPLLTPLIYRNAFDYFYVLILPPAAWLAGIAYQRLRLAALQPTGKFAARLLATIVLLQLVFLLTYVARQWPDRIEAQRVTIAGVHQVFPQPVAYIDGFGAIAGFPKTGFFMSSWGIDNYRANGAAVFPSIVERGQPPMLLADSPSLYAALVPGFEAPDERLLLPADAQFLADHYQQYWGMLFVAGKRFAAGGDRSDFTIAVTGDYRLEGTGPVRIDGRGYMPGDIVSLSAGPHRFESDAAATEYRLLWAAAAPAPDAAPVDLLTFFAIKPESE